MSRGANAAKSFAANELPALNPNQPNHSRAAPSSTYGMLVGLNDGGGASSFCMWAFQGTDPVWGAGIAHVESFLLPTTSAAARADMPAAMCTTMPPAKSIALCL